MKGNDFLPWTAYIQTRLNLSPLGLLFQASLQKVSGLGLSPQIHCRFLLPAVKPHPTRINAARMISDSSLIPVSFSSSSPTECMFFPIQENLSEICTFFHPYLLPDYRK